MCDLTEPSGKTTARATPTGRSGDGQRHREIFGRQAGPEADDIHTVESLRRLVYSEGR
jgi:hypothetical protein